jgi:soluble lytic murein transglycosylase-like protein
MIARQKIAWLALWVPAVVGAESPQESARKAMEASVARQRQAVMAMQIPIARQRAALAGARPDAGSAAAPAVAAGGSAPAAASPAPFFTLSWPALGAACDPLPESELNPLIEQAAQKEEVDANLLRAVAEQESGFRSCAVSPKGAMGLMQLMPATVQELGVNDPFDPAQSLLSGARLLKQLLARFGGDRALALGAYNAGAGRVEESGGIPPIPETIRYVQQILSKLPIP